MEINKITLKEFRAEFVKAVTPLAEKLNIQINAGAIAYEQTGFRFRVEVVNAGNPEEAQKLSFEKHCGSYGLKKEDYYKELKYNGKTFNLVGFKPKSSKYPLIAILNGKRYKLPFDEKIRQLLGVKW